MTWKLVVPTKPQEIVFVCSLHSKHVFSSAKLPSAPGGQEFVNSIPQTIFLPLTSAISAITYEQRVWEKFSALKPIQEPKFLLEIYRVSQSLCGLSNPLYAYQAIFTNLPGFEVCFYAGRGLDFVHV